jgi:hypothetical protein
MWPRYISILTHIYAGVPVDRQKLMAKGAWIGVLKDDADLGALPIKPGLAIMLMGSADVVAAPAAPVR